MNNSEGYRMWRCMIVLGMIVSAFMANWAMADTLITHDGRQFLGKLVAKTDSVVIFEVGTPPLTAQKVFMADEVKEVVIDPSTVPQPATPAAVPAAPTPAPAAPGDAAKTQATEEKTDEPPAKATMYMVVPVHGVFGREIKANMIEKAMNEAKKAKADIIVLEITSPGGRVSELFDMIDLATKWQDSETIPLVAMIKGEAYSAAAVFAMACKKVYMIRGSAMGAALAINTGGKEITAVNEKFSSAIRGKARTGCEAAGRDPLIVEAMMDPDMGLCMAKNKEGKPVLLRGEPKDYDKQSDRFSTPIKVILAKGKLLTLTPGEALECGVINGEIKSFDDLPNELGYEQWASAGKSAERLIGTHEREIEKNLKKYRNMADKVEKGISVVLQTSGYALVQLEGTIVALRSLINEIENMGEKYDYVAEQIHHDFPEGGLAKLKFQCDKAIGEIRTLRGKR